MSNHIPDYYEDVEDLNTEQEDALEVDVERQAGTLGENIADDTEQLEVRGKSSKSEDEIGGLTDADLAEAESLSVSCKANERQQLEDAMAEFLARGGKVQEVPADDSLHF